MPILIGWTLGAMTIGCMLWGVGAMAWGFPVIL
jgi:hypothetical protein